MYPESPIVNINLELLQPIGRWAYRLNDVENSPTLELVRGRTYNLLVDVPPPYDFWIKTSLGVGIQFAYNDGVIGNGTQDIRWRVAENTPSRLAYQSFAFPEVSGCISVTDLPPALPSGNFTLGDIERELDRLERSLPSSPKDLAGNGLRFNGFALELVDSNRRFLSDVNGSPYTTASTFDIDSNRASTARTPLDLQDWLDTLATEIARIKGSTSYNSSNFMSLKDLKDRIDNIELELVYLKSLT